MLLSRHIHQTTSGEGCFDSWYILLHPQGIYPDLLHILDLAIYVDIYSSAFLHWTDDASFFDGRTRDERLLKMYTHYSKWCVENRSFGNDIFSKFDPGIFGVFEFERIFDFFLAIEFNNKVSQMEAGQEQFFFQLRPFKRRILPIHQLVKKN